VQYWNGLAQLASLTLIRGPPGCWLPIPFFHSLGEETSHPIILWYCRRYCTFVICDSNPHLPLLLTDSFSSFTPSKLPQQNPKICSHSHSQKSCDAPIPRLSRQHETLFTVLTLSFPFLWLWLWLWLWLEPLQNVPLPMGGSPPGRIAIYFST
jgi:hypothetical protein